MTAGSLLAAVAFPIKDSVTNRRRVASDKPMKAVYGPNFSRGGLKAGGNIHGFEG